MTARPPKCHWNSDRGWLSPEHVSDCADPACRGCRPCPKTHCAMWGSCANHVEPGLATCPSCIGRTRRDIAKIVELTATMPEEAQHAGVDSEAANLAGPAAAPSQVAARRDAGLPVEDYGKRDGKPIADDPHHPYAVLGRWDMALRESYGPYTDLFVTVVRAADYLTSLLAGPFPHGDEFEDFAREIAACRSHLEDVAHDGLRHETGRPCPECARATPEGKAPALRKRYDPADKTGASDTWECPDVPAHTWGEADYRLRVAADYLDNLEWLTPRQARDGYGIGAARLRKWAERGRIERREQSPGRWTYHGETVRRLAEDGCA